MQQLLPLSLILQSAFKNPSVISVLLKFGTVTGDESRSYHGHANTAGTSSIVAIGSPLESLYAGIRSLCRRNAPFSVCIRNFVMYISTKVSRF